MSYCKEQRLFDEKNQRISTAVFLKDGLLLQVYPERKEFSTKALWKASWEATVQQPLFETSELDRKKVQEQQAFLATSIPPGSDWHLEVFPENKTFTLPPGRYWLGSIHHKYYNAQVEGPFPKSVLIEELGFIKGPKLLFQNFVVKKGPSVVYSMVTSAGKYIGSDRSIYEIEWRNLVICSSDVLDVESRNIKAGHFHEFKEPAVCWYVDNILYMTKKKRVMRVMPLSKA